MGGSNNSGNRKNQNKRNKYPYDKKKNVNTEIENLEMTNSFDVIIDNERLTDVETLDVSFVDEKKDQEKVLNEVIEVLDENDCTEQPVLLDVSLSPNKNGEVLNKILIIVCALLLGFLLCFIVGKCTNAFTVIETVTETKVVVDDNYVFVGDSIFEWYDLEKYYEGMPVVNSGVSGHKTTDILNDINNRIYRYNPSKVILMIGTNDFINGITPEQTVENIEKIIDGIKENRPYAKIYVQSIYPVNKTNNSKIKQWMVSSRNNETIMEVNSNIKKLCKEKDVTYMDIYSKLVGEDGNIKIDYTVEGLHVTDSGYKVITEEVMKVLKD